VVENKIGNETSWMTTQGQTPQARQISNRTQRVGSKRRNADGSVLAWAQDVEVVFKRK
jgi:hypothetical protein